MEELKLNESVIEEDIKEETHKEEKLPKVQSRKIKNEYKEKECKVISYNKKNLALDVKFDKYGIRIKDVKDFSGESVVIKYKGEIGKSNFEYKL